MNARQTALTVTGLVLYAILWAPLVVIVVYSFNTARFGAAWGGFTTDWYRALWTNDAALRATRTTLLLAALSTGISTVLGTMLGLALGRGAFRGRASMRSALQIPMLVPDVVYAVALLLLFAAFRSLTPFFELGLGTMTIGHVSFQVPFVALVVAARAAGMDRTLEEAARDLGATPAQTFWHVTLPLLRPGIVAGSLLAFTLSLDDFAVSFFTGGPGTATLPVHIYASARRGITPDINALSTLLVALTMLIVLIGGLGRKTIRP